MRLESLKLRNIRSYETGYVEFPEGSVLLSGEVGSGKSSLLLATEFALFGIKRGELSGDALLRRGEDSGSVELTFSIDGREVVVGRSLKRAYGGVRQDEGYLITDGVKRELTATELKARILGLLGYPQELVTKQKSLIYRFTVYTPQEQVKDIIRADNERRLDTLRKVFGVDRYKQIRENTDELLRALRSKRRELGILYRDLDQKKQEKEDRKEALEKIRDNLSELGEKRKVIDGEIEKLRKQGDEIREKIELYNRYNAKLSEQKARREALEDIIEGLKEDIEERSEKVAEAEKLERPTEHSDEQLKTKIEEQEELIQRYLTKPSGLDDELDELMARQSEAEEEKDTKRDELTATNTTIESLEESIAKLRGAEKVCPVCGRELDEEHKDKTLDEFYQRLQGSINQTDGLREHINELEGNIEELGKQIDAKIDEEVEKHRRKIGDIEKTREKLRKYQEKMKKAEEHFEEIKELLSEKTEQRQKLEKLKDNIEDLQGKLEALKDIKTRREEIEQKLGKKQEEYAKVRETIAGREAEKTNLEEHIERLEEEIENKTEAREFSVKLGNFQSWFEDYLVNLSRTIERHFMVELRRQFDPLFKDWFNLLIEDELLNVRIDDQFAPVIEQEGYTAEYENLSGGESASVALAYRLALNKVINSLIEDINSRDLIILDEPTDGFSNEQLDKIRDIIHQLDTRQTIIVSHEPKIESYVDNIIRIRKESGISQIQEMT